MGFGCVSRVLGEGTTINGADNDNGSGGDVKREVCRDGILFGIALSGEGIREVKYTYSHFYYHFTNSLLLYLPIHLYAYFYVYFCGIHTPNIM